MRQDYEIVPFLSRFEDTKEWAVFSVLADFFADVGDDVGSAWAMWVRNQKLMPAAYYFYLNGMAKSYNWCLPYIGKASILPLEIESQIPGYCRDFWLHGGTFSECYLVLLHAYRDVYWHPSVKGHPHYQPKEVQ